MSSSLNDEESFLVQTVRKFVDRDVKPTVQDANETDNGFKYESVQFGLNGAALFARLAHRF